MGLLPKLSAGSQSQVVTSTFYGYKHLLTISEGELYDTKNLTTDGFPMLQTRKKRGLVRTLNRPQGMIEKDALAYIDSGTLYVNHQATALTGLSEGDKQLVSMGAYICIFPDKMYYNTEDGSDYGSMEAHYSTSGSVTYKPCTVDGAEYQNAVTSTSAPENPDNLALWIDVSGETPELKQYSASEGEWVSIATVYTKVGFTTQGVIPLMFSEYDGVSVSGLIDELCGDKIIYACGGEENVSNDYIVLVGFTTTTSGTGTVNIDRDVPAMDFVCESNNRLWGCFYGNDGTQNLNEIYCCALGDFKNWRQYMGLSTDSWTASVGSDGQWTGAINYLGYPTFFKEGHIHRVAISSVGAHQIVETVCRGVQKGSHKSLCIVNETLYYKSKADVCRYQGGFPESVSAALGDVLYSDAVAGTYRSKYYICMKEKSEPRLFVYDIEKGLWMKEDDAEIKAFCSVGDELYAYNSAGELLTLLGSDGELEGDFEWMAESGIEYYTMPGKKYLSRYDIRLKLEPGAIFKLAIEYDSNGEWREMGALRRRGLGSVVLPVRPRRCDHLKLRLYGKGGCQIMAITRVLEQGSDV